MFGGQCRRKKSVPSYLYLISQLFPCWETYTVNKWCDSTVPLMLWKSKFTRTNLRSWAGLIVTKDKLERVLLRVNILCYHNIDTIQANLDVCLWNINCTNIREARQSFTWEQHKQLRNPHLRHMHAFILPCFWDNNTAVLMMKLVSAFLIDREPTRESIKNQTQKQLRVDVFYLQGVAGRDLVCILAVGTSVNQYYLWSGVIHVDFYVSSPRLSTARHGRGERGSSVCWQTGSYQGCQLTPQAQWKYLLTDDLLPFLFCLHCTAHTTKLVHANTCCTL